MAPVVVGTIGARPLQGREPEMGLLASLIDGVGSKGAALVLRGEPGIGKSRLLLLIAALNDRDSTSEVLAAAALAEGRSIDLDALEPAALAGLIELDVSSVRFR